MKTWYGFLKSEWSVFQYSIFIIFDTVLIFLVIEKTFCFNICFNIANGFGSYWYTLFSCSINYSVYCFHQKLLTTPSVWPHSRLESLSTLRSFWIECNSAGIYTVLNSELFFFQTGCQPRLNLACPTIKTSDARRDNFIPFQKAFALKWIYQNSTGNRTRLSYFLVQNRYPLQHPHAGFVWEVYQYLEIYVSLLHDLKWAAKTQFTFKIMSFVAAMSLSISFSFIICKCSWLLGIYIFFSLFDYYAVILVSC